MIRSMIDQNIRTRRKTIALIIQPDGRLVVRAPLRVSNATIRQLVEEKASWIRTKREQIKTAPPPPAPKKYQNGEEFWYLGQRYPLEIVKAPRPLLTLNGKFCLAQAALPKAPAVFESWYKQQAALILAERTRQFALQHGFQFTKVRITSARTRWGSCSSRGTLNFTWRLVMAPLPMIDYVVIHELVHLQIKNHSKDFWGKVGSLMPDYQSRRKWLKTNHLALNL
jgi:predicted metal-dependent hydrolase